MLFLTLLRTGDKTTFDSRQMQANYVFKPTAEQALRSIQSAARRRLNTALAIQGSMDVIRKYSVPSFLLEGTAQADYERWLRRKTQAHLRRDRERGNELADGESYRRAIHAAVCSSDGKDFYTGEALDWSLIGKYDNVQSEGGRRTYKQSFALLPTVDHVGDGTGTADFVICSWRTNDAKNDLNLGEFIELCKRVLKHAGYVIGTAG